MKAGDFTNESRGLTAVIDKITEFGIFFVLSLIDGYYYNVKLEYTVRFTDNVTGRTLCKIPLNISCLTLFFFTRLSDNYVIREPYRKFQFTVD